MSSTSVFEFLGLLDAESQKINLLDKTHKFIQGNLQIKEEIFNTAIKYNLFLTTFVKSCFTKMIVSLSYRFRDTTYRQRRRLWEREIHKLLLKRYLIAIKTVISIIIISIVMINIKNSVTSDF